ncbi:Peroxidase 68 [Striga hermonthica]|uniref:Peroxidase n=1 Tax=Striga hermonthica TaxID=68872 RepID=A0A9N7N940_STRHE|nr:Peroxidase 68 [Striga hermonthica]
MSSKLIKALIPLQFVLFFVCISKPSRSLKYHFYRDKCAGGKYEVESIVSREVKLLFEKDKSGSIAPGLLRLFFHDCFVRGCDASILLDSTPGNPAEKDASPNKPSLRESALDAVDYIKGRLEFLCPGVVSCADIIAFAARESVVLTGGPPYKVAGGRKDGIISKSAEAQLILPSPQSDLNTITAAFKNKGLTEHDMIALLGAHTIGQSHCNSFNNRLPPNPTDMDKSSVAVLQKLCSQGPNTLVNMDNDTPNKFDNNYYNYVLEHKALFSSDDALLTGRFSLPLVQKFKESPNIWFENFTIAMDNMGKLSDTDQSNRGEIRSNCRQVNSRH